MTLCLLRMQILILLRECGFAAERNEQWRFIVSTILVESDLDYTQFTNVWRASLLALPIQRGDIISLSKIESSNELWEIINRKQG